MTADRSRMPCIMDGKRFRSVREALISIGFDQAERRNPRLKFRAEGKVTVTDAEGVRHTLVRLAADRSRMPCIMDGKRFHSVREALISIGFEKAERHKPRIKLRAEGKVTVTDAKGVHHTLVRIEE